MRNLLQDNCWVSTQRELSLLLVVLLWTGSVQELAGSSFPVAAAALAQIAQFAATGQPPKLPVLVRTAANLPSQPVVPEPGIVKGFPWFPFFETGGLSTPLLPVDFSSLP